MDEAVEVTARCLAIDAVAAELMTTLSDRGLSCILLKGASTDRWLYHGGAPRGYVDIDLLMPPDDVVQGEHLLEEEGFEREFIPVPTPDYLDHSQAWMRERDGMQVDVHRTLTGVGAPVDRVFPALSAATETMNVGGRDVVVLSPHARAMVLALHPAGHGRGTSQPLEDLSRALDMLPEDTWRAAGALARDLDALEAFATGLRFLPAGQALAQELGLDRARNIEVEMAANDVPYSSWFVARFARTPGLRGKLALLGPKLAPSPTSMRVWYPVARRGSVGLILAYVVVRPLWLASHVVPAIRGWWRARRAVR